MVCGRCRFRKPLPPGLMGVGACHKFIVRNAVSIHGEQFEKLIWFGQAACPKFEEKRV